MTSDFATRQRGKAEHIAVHGVFPVSIWGRPETSDFLIHEIGEPVPGGEIRGRCLPLLAVVGIVDGRPQTALETELPGATIQTLADLYVRHVVTKIEASFGLKTPSGDAVEWLKRLYQMPGEA